MLHCPAPVCASMVFVAVAQIINACHFFTLCPLLQVVMHA